MNIPILFDETLIWRLFWSWKKRLDSWVSPNIEEKFEELKIGSDKILLLDTKKSRTKLLLDLPTALAFIYIGSVSILFLKLKLKLYSSLFEKYSPNHCFPVLNKFFDSSSW